MKALPLISLGLSLALGAGAIFFGREFMSDSGPEANAAISAPAIQMTSVLVAATTIEPGKLIDPAMVKSVDWPASAVPPGAVRSLTDLGETPYARGLMVTGEPLMAEKVDTAGTVLTLAAHIAPGMRAVSIVVRNDTGVAGFVLPGDRVDVNEFLDADGPGGAVEGTRMSGKLIARTVLKGVRVLAVDQTFESGLEGARPSNTVTLEVTPEDALQLGAASQRAALGLALIGRAEEAIEIVAAPPVAAAPPPRPQTRSPRAAAPRASTTTIRVINGSEDSEVKTPVAPPPAAAEPTKLAGGAG